MDGEDPKEELLQRHKEEKKELQSQITKLKHTVSKGDKKGKKAVQEQISQLEKDLKERHDKELTEVEEASLTEPEKVYILTKSYITVEALHMHATIYSRSQDNYAAHLDDF